MIIIVHIFSSGYTLLRNPHHNKGLAFTDKERDTHYLRGLLPPTVISQDLQVIYVISNQFSESNFGSPSFLVYKY